MPKFNLYPTPRPDQADGSDARVEVGWGPNGVQFATTKLQPGAERGYEYFTGPDGQKWRSWDGQFVDLDRDQINNLIRHLREARDKAFGRDE